MGRSSRSTAAPSPKNPAAANRRSRAVNTEPALAEEYMHRGWWSREAASVLLRRRAVEKPDGLAYIDGGYRWTWEAYNALADDVAALLGRLGIIAGERVAAYLPDGVIQHASYVATERSGAIAVGVPGRADDHEVTQLVAR